MTESEQLSTGWESTVPEHDTLVRRYLFAWARMCDAFAVAAGGATVWTPEFAASHHGRPASFYTSATLLRPPAGPSGEQSRFDAVVDEIERSYPPGSGDIHLWSAWPTPDLRHRGWELVGHPPLLIRPPAAVLPPPAAPSGVRLAEVSDAATLADWERVAIEGYPLDDLAPFRPGRLVDPAVLKDPRLVFTLGYDVDGSAPVSLSALYVDPTSGGPTSGGPTSGGPTSSGRTSSGPGTGGPGTGGPGTGGLGAALHDLTVFSLGVTMPGARGKGHWLAHAVHRLQQAPDYWAAGVFSDYSRSPAERLGFLPVVRFTLWTRPTTDDPSVNHPSTNN